jgi:hypothetical protein
MVLARRHCARCRGWQKALCTCKKKCNIDMISLVLSVFDWHIVMIGPSGLLLVVPHLYPFAAPVLLGDLQKRN